jgi:hypothetical protein
VPVANTWERVIWKVISSDGATRVTADSVRGQGGQLRTGVEKRQLFVQLKFGALRKNGMLANPKVSEVVVNMDNNKQHHARRAFGEYNAR